MRSRRACDAPVLQGEVLVNGQVETRRRKQLSVGDVVETLGQTLTVNAEDFD